jgi:hypothetical protein
MGLDRLNNCYGISCHALACIMTGFCDHEVCCSADAHLPHQLSDIGHVITMLCLQIPYPTNRDGH